MAQQSDSNLKLPGQDKNMYSKMPYGGRKELPPMDSNPKVQKDFQQLASADHLSPGMGLGTPTWAPDAGFQRERQRRMAQGATARERMEAFQEAGVKDEAGIKKIFERAYVSPEKAFMLARRK